MERNELFVDLYELIMLQAYFDEGMQGEAVFDLHIRSLPPQRNFLIACGLEQVLDYLEALAFSAESLGYLESLKLFTSAFLEHLSRFQFRGSVRAVPEGTVVFAQEPLLEVSAPIRQAQLVETYLLNQVTFQTLIASKGARSVLAAGGRTLVDFGSRRAHGTDGALKAARALHISGYEATSNVKAGSLYGIPVAGTMAHSYIEAHDSEESAFVSFMRSFRDTVLLIDTYDTGEAASIIGRLAKETGDAALRAVRIDSGDLVEQSTKVRQILDAAGLQDVRILVSGGLDEYEIERIVKSGAPVASFGVGTAAVVSADAPVLDSAYKLAWYDGKPRMKLSPGKITLPGRKQVFRRVENGTMAIDVIGLSDEVVEGEPLLREVMRNGQRTGAARATLEPARENARQQLAMLPERLKSLEPAREPFRVVVSPRLEEERTRLEAKLSRDTHAVGEA